MIRLVALIGKKGSVFKATLNIVRELGLPIELLAAVTCRDALTPSHQLPTEAIQRWHYGNRQRFFSQLDQFLASYSPAPVLFSWFDKLVPSWFLNKHAMVNQHPSLLPAFPGMDAWQQALTKGVLVTGTTIHIIDEGVDTGPILLQHGMSLQPNRDLIEQRHRLFLLQVFQAVTFFYLLTQIEPNGTGTPIPTFPFETMNAFEDTNAIVAFFRGQPIVNHSTLKPWIQHVTRRNRPS